MTKAAELAKMGEVLTNSQIGGRRNILINGSQIVSQRATSTTFAHDGTTSGFTTDRFNIALGGTHEQLDGTLAQVADHPTSTNGKSLKWTTGTAESSYDADEYIYIAQKIEAQNVQHLQYGNSNAQPITVSFYVKSSITGTFALGLYKPDSTARIHNQTYAISSANTWEKKTLTFVGDTDSGAGIVNDTGQGVWASWHLSAGSNATGGGSNGGWKNYGGLTDWADGQGTNAVMTTASATWQMTECQVEVGSQATPFEHRSFGEELALCQRYCFRINDNGSDAIQIGNGYYVTGTTTRAVVTFPVTMRGIPTVTTLDAGLGILRTNVVDNSVTLDGINDPSTYSTGLNLSDCASDTIGEGIVLRIINGTSGFLEADAEL
mgnify:CR=1 FL=1|tara:strand:+ start:447 stop:1580 length:1134 start_codon:yes stop_codon:yes gene_type:complete